MGYLGDFLFRRSALESPVRILSGGERNRLLLAKLFAKPANVLVLDEPTNDLDIESLELLEDTLQALSRHVAARQPRPRLSRQRRHPDARAHGRGAVARVRRRLQRLDRAAPAPIAARASARAGAAASTAADAVAPTPPTRTADRPPSSIIAKAVTRAAAATDRDARGRAAGAARAHGRRRLSPARARRAQGRSRAPAEARARAGQGLRALGPARRPHPAARDEARLPCGALLVRCVRPIMRIAATHEEQLMARLAGRFALVTGASPASVARSPSRWRRKAQQWR